MHQDTGWDYLILTASNDAQAKAYQAQIQLRQKLGLLPQISRAMVVPDKDGARIGSGGATVRAIARIVGIERARSCKTPDQILCGLRILLVHAGGDSRRLPAYGPCGKIFVPLPGFLQSALPPALFDRLMPALLDLPAGAPGRGQIIVAAGDALMHWDSSGLDFSHSGITMLGCRATPEEASRHGVLCLGKDNSVTRFLQKPSRLEQERAGALMPSGEAVLDIGVMSMDAAAAAALLSIFNNGDDAAAEEWAGHGGLDLYREICCALGSSATLEHYVASARAGGSSWPDAGLAKLYPGLHEVAAHAYVLPRCRFLHFGSARQLAPSGMAALERDQGIGPADSLILVNNVIDNAGSVSGLDSWVEGCRIQAPLDLAERNVVVGVDIEAPLALPQEACLEALAGFDREGSGVWFTRIYGIGDTFKDSVARNGRFCGLPMLDWISAAGIDPDDVWPGEPDPSHRTLWNARVFPAGTSHDGFRRWLWMNDPGGATIEEKRAYAAADLYSAAEIAILTNQRAFHWRRLENWTRMRPDIGSRIMDAAASCFGA